MKRRDFTFNGRQFSINVDLTHHYGVKASVEGDVGLIFNRDDVAFTVTEAYAKCYEKISETVLRLTVWTSDPKFSVYDLNDDRLKSES